MSIETSGLKIFDPLTISRVMPGEVKNNGKQSIRERVLEFDLSDKELKIINLLAEGKTCKEIAVEFDLAESYIRNMLIRINDKLGILNRIRVWLWWRLRRRMGCWGEAIWW